MAKPRRPAKARAAHGYVLAADEKGPILGRIVQQTASGRITLQLDDGSVIELESPEGLTPVADPATFGPVLFQPDLPNDPLVALDELLSLFRHERNTVEGRRAWAEEHGGDSLPDERDVDELIRFRYDTYRGLWRQALRHHLESSVRSGNHRALVLVLDPSLPAEPRRIALEVAVAERVTAAVPSLCAGAIRQTQVAFARDAIRALVVLAPERLPLIARHVSPELVGSIDQEAVSALPEAAFIENALHGTAPSGQGVEGFQIEGVLDLLLAYPIEDQIRLLREAAGTLGAFVRQAVRARFDVLAQQESLTTYDTILRGALAQVILGDPTPGGLSDLRNVAARCFTRDVDTADLLAAIQFLPETSVVRLTSAELKFRRGVRIVALLSALTERRPNLAKSLASTLRGALKSADVDNEARVAALRFLTHDVASHDLVSVQAVRELGREPTPTIEGLCRAIVAAGIDIDVRGINRSGLLLLARSLANGTAAYAARFLERARRNEDAETAQILMLSTIRPEWVERDAALRGELLAWLPLLIHESAASAGGQLLLNVLEHEPSENWEAWRPQIRDAALRLIATTAPEQASDLLTRVVRVASDTTLKSRVLETLVNEVLTYHPTRAERISALVSGTVLRPAIMSALVSVQDGIAKRNADFERENEASARDLAAHLTAEIERITHAIGSQDQLGVLFDRLKEELRAAASAIDPRKDPDVESFESEFGDNRVLPEQRRREAVLTGLRRTGVRSRSSPAAISFFRRTAETMLASMDSNELNAFVVDSRQALDRLDAVAMQPIAVALVKHGTPPAQAWDLLGNGADPKIAIDIAVATWRLDQDRSLSLLDVAGVEFMDLATTLSVRAAELRELDSKCSPSATGLADLGRRLAPTLEAIEGLMLNYMRVRRVLAEHRLMPIEPVLGNVRDAGQLAAGTHRIIGASLGSGFHEVVSLGLRLADSGEVIAPAAVAPISNPARSEAQEQGTAPRAADAAP